MYIGLTGPIASGKGVAAEYFKSRGFHYISLSKILREIAKQNGIPEERKALQDLGNAMREKHGVGFLASEACKKIRAGNTENCVIDGIRNPGEVDELRKNLKGFVLISIDADFDKRFEWAFKRNKDSDPKTKSGFMSANSRDLGEGEKNTGQAVANCMKIANHIVLNDGTERELTLKIDKLYRAIKSHGD